MRNISNNTIKILSFDIDNTLIDLETLQTGFSAIWQEFPPRSDVVLTYNTGRLYDDVIGLIQRHIIPAPDFIVGGVGTHIYDYRNETVLNEFEKVLEEGWNLELVEKIVSDLPYKIECQPDEYQHIFKRSFFLKNAQPVEIRNIEDIFSASELEVNIVYSGNKYLDILPKWANKGNALSWLLDFLKTDTEKALVAGDSGNDLAMFNLEGINGIVVGNAEQNLVQRINSPNLYQARRQKYAGVVEGLVHFNVISKDALIKIDQNGKIK